MKQLLDSNIEIFVESDFIYMPLLFDPEVVQEIQALFQPQRPQAISTPPALNTIIRLSNRYFVKGLEIHSLLDNFKAINAYDYERLRNHYLRKYYLLSEIDDIFIDETLRIILFQVMPYFVRKNRRLERKKLNNEEMLDFISKKINIPLKYHQDAKSFRNLEPLKEILRNLKDQKPITKFFKNGLTTTRKLRDWFNEAIQEKILADEQDRIEKSLQVRQEFSKTKTEHIAVMLYIADTGALEIDGFGFTKSNSYTQEYLVYKRTGEYTLQDYYARSYLFPDCRVAISTYTPFWPFVIEKYKHPFLLRHKPGQEICMKDYRPPEELTAENIINVLEEGLTALRYGYDGRRRNGYHSLDKTWVHIPTIDFEEYRV
ncbi:MAG: hypothetical protein JSW04_13545 [Desulfobacterales bacterium]|nr:MAG: hypothetical protein JSV38_05975 [Desulfobacterales bacterium]UCD89426.1 MAG: hypothetical protein JSW04_13545 [Desulfobacterales bacterium]